MATPPDAIRVKSMLNVRSCMRRSWEEKNTETAPTSPKTTKHSPRPRKRARSASERNIFSDPCLHAPRTLVGSPDGRSRHLHGLPKVHYPTRYQQKVLQ